MKNNSIILITIFAVLAVFGIAAFAYKANKAPAPAAVAEIDSSNLIRPHSPIIGPVDAPVTIVEFFDPSCEACKASFPFVEEILARYPTQVRLVLRYAPFHEGSDVAVGILEAARLQNLFEPVLKALFQAQHEWAIHGAPNLDKAWEIAGTAGLDINRAKTDAAKPEVAEVLKLDMEDIETHKVRQTPTFFVNGKRLMQLGPKPFELLVTEEVQKAGNP